MGLRPGQNPNWDLNPLSFGGRAFGILGFSGGSVVKNQPAKEGDLQETRVWCLSWEDPLKKEVATHSRILAWEIPWTEESGGLQSMGSQRIGCDWATKQQQQPPVVLHPCPPSSIWRQEPHSGHPFSVPSKWTCGTNKHQTCVTHILGFSWILFYRGKKTKQPPQTNQKRNRSFS